MTSLAAQSSLEVRALERRWSIISAATCLFARKGFVATSMDDIAEEAQVTKRTVYRHMTSKGHVLLAIHERMLGLVRATLEESGALQKESATEALMYYVHAHVSVITTYTTEATVFLEQMKNLSAQLRDEVVADRDEYENSLKLVIARGIDTGQFREVDPGLVTQSTLGALNDLYRWYRPSGVLEPGHIADIAVRLILYGLDGFAAREPARDWDTARIGQLRREANGIADRRATEIPSLLFDKVVDRAAVLFAQQGYQGTSSAELAAAADLGKGALYYHIDGKAQVLAVVVERVMAAAEAGLAGVIAGASSHEGLLRDVIIEQCLHIGRHQSAVRVTLEETRYLPTEVAAQLTDRQRRYQDLVVLVISSYIGIDAVTPAQLKVIAFLELGAVDFISRWFSAGGLRTIGQIADEIADVILHGIAGPSPALSADDGSRSEPTNLNTDQ